jgi:ribonuclease D
MSGGPEPEPARVSTPLTAPRDGTPRPVETADELAEVVARMAAGTGPVAVDAERASGYRYTQKAYLVQLRRAGAGTVLIDPCPWTTCAPSTRPSPRRNGCCMLQARTSRAWLK